jgi:glycosyltransferase involved in cell wall biosynthesis
LALNNKFNSEVLKAGEYGHLFEKNIESLTHLMMASEKEDAATQLRVQTMRSNSTKGLVERYQWDYIIEQYYQIFINL